MYAFYSLFLAPSLSSFFLSYNFHRALYIWILFIAVSYFVYSPFFSSCPRVCLYSLSFSTAHNTKNVHRLEFIIYMSMNPSNAYSDVCAVAGCLFTTKIIEIVFVYTNQQLKIKVEKKTKNQSKAKRTKQKRIAKEKTHTLTRRYAAIAFRMLARCTWSRFVVGTYSPAYVFPFERVARMHACVCVSVCA